MPPKGWRKAPENEPRFLAAPQWAKSFIPFGDRLNFLSGEGQHLASGKLRILPPRHPERRKRDDVPSDG